MTPLGQVRSRGVPSRLYSVLKFCAKPLVTWKGRPLLSAPKLYIPTLKTFSEVVHRWFVESAW